MNMTMIIINHKWMLKIDWEKKKEKNKTKVFLSIEFECIIFVYLNDEWIRTNNKNSISDDAPQSSSNKINDRNSSWILFIIDRFTSNFDVWWRIFFNWTNCWIIQIPKSIWMKFRFIDRFPRSTDKKTNFFHDEKPPIGRDLNPKRLCYVYI